MRRQDTAARRFDSAIVAPDAAPSIYNLCSGRLQDATFSLPATPHLRRVTAALPELQSAGLSARDRPSSHMKDPRPCNSPPKPANSKTHFKTDRSHGTRMTTNLIESRITDIEKQAMKWPTLRQGV